MEKNNKDIYEEFKFKKRNTIVYTKYISALWGII